MHRRWLPWILSLSSMACSEAPATTGDAASVDDVALDLVTAPDAAADVAIDRVAQADVITVDTVAADAARLDAVTVDTATTDTVAVDTAAADAVALDAARDVAGDVARDAVTATDTGPEPYPAGPYGNTAGQTLASLDWEGYVNLDGAAVSNTLPYGATSLRALRGGRRGYAVVHTSEFY